MPYRFNWFRLFGLSIILNAFFSMMVVIGDDVEFLLNQVADLLAQTHIGYTNPLIHSPIYWLGVISMHACMRNR